MTPHLVGGPLSVGALVAVSLVVVDADSDELECREYLLVVVPFVLAMLASYCKDRVR